MVIIYDVHRGIITGTPIAQKDCSEGSMARIPLIIDSDPGLGDAVTIAASLCSELLDVKALTVVAGQQSVENTLQNALDNLGYTGIDFINIRAIFYVVLKGIRQHYVYRHSYSP